MFIVNAVAPTRPFKAQRGHINFQNIVNSIRPNCVMPCLLPSTSNWISDRKEWCEVLTVWRDWLSEINLPHCGSQNFNYHDAADPAFSCGFAKLANFATLW